MILAKKDRFIRTKTGSVSEPSQSQYQSWIQQSLCPHSTDLTQSVKVSVRDSPVKVSVRDSPVKVLDLPNFRDDFYLNTADWSESGELAIALNSEAYIYTPERIVEVCRSPLSTYISSVRLNDSLLAVGCSTGQVEVYDLHRLTLLRTLTSHSSRVSALEFLKGQLATGSKDREIQLNDLRVRESVVKRCQLHRGEVFSLKKSPTDDSLFASGSSDATVGVWDLRADSVLHRLKGHHGAVKAISWCPWKAGMLATGGGSKDQSIRLWSAESGRGVGIQAVGSQVSSLLWNEQLGSLVSSHGYKQGSQQEQSQVNFWRVACDYQQQQHTLTLQQAIQAHHRRVLNMLQSADSSHLCTFSADQTMKFWRLTPPPTAHTPHTHVLDTARL